MQINSLNKMIAGLNLSGIHKDILLLVWLSNKKLDVNLVNECIYPDKVNEITLNNYVQDLIMADLLLSEDKVNLLILQNSIFNHKEEIPKYKQKDSSIYTTFQEVFGVPVHPTYQLETKIKQIIKSGITKEQIKEAIKVAGNLKWLSNHTSKSWFGLMWLLTKVPDFLDGGKYAEKQDVNKEEHEIDFGI